MRFVICGAGAIGGVLGGQLARAGFAVIFIDKISQHVAAINRQGLQLKGVHGTHRLTIPAVLQFGQASCLPKLGQPQGLPLRYDWWCISETDI